MEKQSIEAILRSLSTAPTYKKKPFVDNGSTEIFKLRKEKKLDEAYEKAINLYKEQMHDEWIQKALAWVLIDLIKAELPNNTNKAHDFFQQLNTINFVTEDDILSKQINSIKRQFNPEYALIIQAEALSKNGNHIQSLNIFRQLKQENKLNQDSLETYGWEIYKYIKASETTLPIEEIKKLLFEYLKLENVRPSLLHSVILQFVIHYVDTHKDFDIFKFFQLWDSKNLRNEDIHDQYASEADKFRDSIAHLIKSKQEVKKHTSLLKKLLRVIVASKYPFDINYLINTSKNQTIVIESLREIYFWKILNTHKEMKIGELWYLFDFYATNFSNFNGSRWHSEILNLAERFMIEKESWRFFEFFKKWDYKNFQSEDWKEQKNGEFINKSLVAKSLKSIFKLIKDRQEKTIDIRWVVELYKLAFERLEKTIWLSREYAIVLYKSGLNKEAIDIYKKIILELGDHAYIWHEFSKIVATNEPNIAIAMLCKAMTIQKNEDYLEEMHIDLAKLLISKNMKKEAYVELKLYEQHRQEKKWKLPPEFNPLLSQCSNEFEENQNNKNFYINNLNAADAYLYADFPWVHAIVDSEFKTDEGKERLFFRDFHNVEFTVSKTRYQLLKHAKKDDVFKFKLFFDETKQRYVPLLIETSSLNKQILIEKAPIEIAIVDHVNYDKKLFHYAANRNMYGIVNFSDTELRPNVGDFIELTYYKKLNKKDNRTFFKVLQVKNTEKINNKLRKKVKGWLELKYKHNDKNYDYYTILEEFNFETDKIPKPSFGFFDDNIYVNRTLLEKCGVEKIGHYFVNLVFDGKEWKAIDIIKEQNV